MEIWLLVLQATVTVVGVIAVSWWAVRRLGVGALVWFAGGLTFIASQVLRLPLISGVQLAGASAAVMGAVAVVTSGVFEEGARYLAFRWGLRRRRSASDGVAFGLGHGGVEAILLIGIAALGGIALLTAGDQLMEATEAAGDEAGAALTEQIRALEELGPGDIVLGVYERILAIIAHIAMTMLVLRAVCQRRLIWLGAAAGFHMLINGVVVTLAGAFGVLAAEAGMTVVAVAALLIIRTAWRDAAHWFPVEESAVPHG